MTKQLQRDLLIDILNYEEKNDIGNMTTVERREFQQRVLNNFESDIGDTYNRLVEKIDDDIGLYTSTEELHKRNGNTYMEILCEGMRNEAESLREYILTIE